MCGQLVTWRRIVRTAVLFGTLVALSVRPAAAQGNLLVNGSFEAPDSSTSPFPWGYTYGVIPTCGCPVAFAGCCIPGWQITAGTVDLVTSEHPPAVGSQSLDLVGSPGAATIQQTFATVPGMDYIFSGYVSHDPGVPYGLANVTLNGVPFVQLSSTVASSAIDAQWNLFAYRFRAASLATTLAISDITGLSDVAGIALDGLSVTLATSQAGLFSSVAKLLINPPGGAPPGSDQATLHVGECATLTFFLRTNTGIIDVTHDPNTTFFTDPPRHGFNASNHSNLFCVTAADTNSAFAIYGRYVNPTTGVAVQNTVHVVVRP